MTSQSHKKRQTTASITETTLPNSQQDAAGLFSQWATSRWLKKVIAGSIIVFLATHSLADDLFVPSNSAPTWKPARTHISKEINRRPVIRTASKPGSAPVDFFNDPFAEPATPPSGKPAGQLSQTQPPTVKPTPVFDDKAPTLGNPKSEPNRIFGTEVDAPTRPITPEATQPTVPLIPSDDTVDEDVLRRMQELRVCPEITSLSKITDIKTSYTTDDKEVLPWECKMDSPEYVARNFPLLTYTYKASSLCSKPLYFEDERLERYGQTRMPLFQPFISGGRFYLDILALPYHMGQERPNECVYALGYYRPGDCVPLMRKRLIPLSGEGTVYQTVAVLALVALVP